MNPFRAFTDPFSSRRTSGATGSTPSIGAWHSEWSALARLLEAGVTAASQAAELTAGLEVDAGRMGDRVAAAADDLLSERGGGGKPGDYLGSTDALIDTVLARAPEGRAAHG